MSDLNWDTIGWPATQTRVRRGPSFLHADDVGYRSEANPTIAVISLETRSSSTTGTRDSKPALPAETDKSEP